MNTERNTYTVALEIVAVSPITHGAGNNGNEQQWRTREHLVDVADPDVPGRTISRRIQVPIVSGAAFKSALRSQAVRQLAEAVGMEDGGLSKDALRLLLKGGKNDSSGQSVSLEEHRRLRALFPLLAVFGSMDGGMPIVAQLQVGAPTPYVEELVDSGLMQTSVGAVQVTLNGQDTVVGDTIEIFPGAAPQRLADLQTVEQYYRHDMSVSAHRNLIDKADVAALEDKVAQNKLAKAPKKEDRRAANESMPHAHQAIIPGARLISVLRLKGATELEWECLAYALLGWIQDGGILGGGATKGHGQCRVNLAGSLRSKPSPLRAAVEPSTAISVNAAGKAYARHIADNVDAIREHLCGA